MGVATVHLEVRAAFREALLATPGLPASIHWEGRAFTPTPGAAWMRESLRPIGSPVRGLGRGGVIEHRMVCGLDLFFPAGGVLPVETAAGAVLAAFAPGRSLAYGTTAARIVQAERGQVRLTPEWASCAVALTVVAYTAS